jgi:hypothetical protein
MNANPLVDALRRHLHGIGGTAAALEQLLADNADRIDLTAEEAARLLLKLQRIARKLEAVADELGGSLDPYPVKAENGEP